VSELCDICNVKLLNKEYVKNGFEEMVEQHVECDIVIYLQQLKQDYWQIRIETKYNSVNSSNILKLCCRKAVSWLTKCLESNTFTYIVGLETNATLQQIRVIDSFTAVATMQVPCEQIGNVTSLTCPVCIKNTISFQENVLVINCLLVFIV